MSPSRITRRRLLIGAGALASATAIGAVATAQQLGQHMVRDGTVGIKDDTERRLFSALICTCGCPRETLSTCTCGIAAERRDVLRAQLQSGMDLASIEAAYAKLYGPQALAIPPNTGANRLVWALPLGALIAGAGAVGVVLRRWQRRGAVDAVSSEASSEAQPSRRDAYDDKLDDELRNLDSDD